MTRSASVVAWAVLSVAVGGSLLAAVPQAPASAAAEEVAVVANGAEVAPAAELFAPVATAHGDGAAAADELLGDLVIRSRPAMVLSDRLPSPVEVGAGGVRIELNLFDDASFDVVLDHVQPGDPQRADSHVLCGKLAGVEESWVFLSVHGEAMIGDVIAPGIGVFEIRFLADGVHEIREVIDNGGHPCGVGPEHHIGAGLRPVDPEAFAGEGAGEGPGAPGQRDGTPGTRPVIDLLMAYTPAARSQAGGTDPIRAAMANWIAQTNTAYANSQMKQRVRSVLMAETDFVETASASTDLSLLQGTGDGNMDELHALRDEYGADLVHLVSRSVGVCGIAYVMSIVSTEFRANGFGLTVYSCGALTFAHELGHNMGCSHDHDNGGAAAFCFSFGHRTPGNQYRTIMSYAPGSRIPYFSNPNITFAGFELGIDGDGCPALAADNAQSMNMTSTTVADFRPQIFEAEPPNDFALLGPEPEAVGVGLTPTLSWQPAQGTTGYFLVVSEFDDLTEPIYQQTVNGFSRTLPPELLVYDRQYYWGVTANGFGGQTPGTPAVATFRTRKLADLSSDGVVNATDLAVMLGVWGPTTTEADLNGDGKVDATDLAMLLGDWG